MTYGGDVTTPTPTLSHLELLRYRRQTAALYAELRGRGTAHLDAFKHFRAARDRLFAEHPQSPLGEAQRRRFRGLSYFPYDPALRFVLPLELNPGATPAALDAAFTEAYGAQGARVRRRGSRSPSASPASFTTPTC